MTPEDALKIAAAHLADLKPSLDRSRLMLDIAAFLIENDGETVYEIVEVDGDDDRRDPNARRSTRGPARRVECAMNPGDSVYVRAVSHGATPLVLLAVDNDGDTETITVSPGEARRYAAGILEAADEAEGRSPLLGFAPDNTGGKPA